MKSKRTAECAADLLVRCALGEKRRPRAMTVLVAQAAYIALFTSADYDAERDVERPWRQLYLDASTLLMSGWRPSVEDLARASTWPRSERSS